MKVHIAPSRRYAEYVRLITCDHWVADDRLTGGDKVVVRCVLNNTTAAYGTHDGGNEWNGARNFAAEIQKGCGCQIIQPRGRKKSRKAFKPSGFVLMRPPATAASGEISELSKLHEQQAGEWGELVANPCRTSASRARALMSEIATTESRLRDLHQPVDSIIG